MGDVPPERRGVVSGLLNLARNLGLITGASVMGAVFAGAAGAGDVANAQPAAVAASTGITFAVATALALAAMAIVARGRARAARPSQPGGA
jgi:hypothetical protein